MARKFLKQFLLSLPLLLCANIANATVYECQQEHNYLWWPDSPNDKYIVGPSGIYFDDELGYLDFGNRVTMLTVKQKIDTDGEIVATAEGKTGSRLGETLFIIRHPRHQKTLSFLFVSADDGATGSCHVSTTLKTLKSK